MEGSIGCCFFSLSGYRRIGLASNIFGRLANIWKRTGLSLQAKIRLYNTLVISVLLYGSETWTLLKADERRLEGFHMNCQRRILGIRWFHFVTNYLHHIYAVINIVPLSCADAPPVWPFHLYECWLIKLLATHLVSQ